MTFQGIIDAVRSVALHPARFNAAERDELMAAFNRAQNRLTMVEPAGPLHRRPDSVVYPFASDRIPR